MIDQLSSSPIQWWLSLFLNLSLWRVILTACTTTVLFYSLILKKPTAENVRVLLRATDLKKERWCKSRNCPDGMPTDSGTSTEDECPIRSPVSSREHVVPFSCCFLTGWLVCLFTRPNPHILKNPTKRQSFRSFQKLLCFFLTERQNIEIQPRLILLSVKMTAPDTS